MRKFLIEKLIADGYDRWANIKLIDDDFTVWAHFIEFDSYVENNSTIGKIKAGDIIQGILKIEYVSRYEITDEDIVFEQPIKESSHLIANATILDIIDEYTLLCHINSNLQKIVVEFENKIKLEIGSRIKFRASLELEIE